MPVEESIRLSKKIIAVGVLNPFYCAGPQFVVVCVKNPRQFVTCP